MMLSISNIGWDASKDASVYELMKQYGYSGLEIAPTRIFPETPYEHMKDAKEWAKCLKKNEGFTVPSMQSIWFGRQEKIFGTSQERQILLEYTKKAIDFAESIGCENLVFGCPRNRNIPEDADPSIAVAFFKELGDYAAEHNTVIGMEANPPIYNTNYINDTASALELIKQVDSEGFKLNLDIGTMIHNQESVELLRGKVKLINHIHISEPGLKNIKHWTLHEELKDVLLDEGYQRFVSIEIGKTEDISIVDQAIRYVKEVFNEE